jgi:hypothetical protein
VELTADELKDGRCIFRGRFQVATWSPHEWNDQILLLTFGFDFWGGFAIIRPTWKGQSLNQVADELITEFFFGPEHQIRFVLCPLKNCPQNDDDVADARQESSSITSDQWTTCWP